MATALDLVGSILTAAFVLILGLGMNDNMISYRYASGATVNLQESLTDAVQTIETDFRKIGFGVADPKSSILISQPDHIRFSADIDRDGTVDVVDWDARWALSEKGSIRGVLVRTVNGSKPLVVATDISEFQLRYLRETGKPADTTAKGQIWVIETSLRMRSPYKIADAVQGTENMKYAEGFWRQTRLASRNLRRHG